MPGFLGFYAEPVKEETGVWSEDGAGGDETEQLAPPTQVRRAAWSDEQREDQPVRDGQSWKQVSLIAAAIFVPLTALVVVIGLWLQQPRKPSEPSRVPMTPTTVATPPVTVTAPPPVTLTQAPPPPETVAAPLTGKWSGPVSGEQSGFDVVADIVDGARLTGTVSYPQLNCAGMWKEHGSTANGIRLITETITQGSCVTSEVTLTPQNDGTLYFTSTYYAASKQRHITIHATLRRFN
jgi:hypothetical protein